VIAAGFVLLLGFTTYWQLWASSSLAARQDNLHEVVREQSIDRGRILTANGEVLAKSVPRKTADGRRIYVRRYPHGPVFAQVTGYSSPSSNRSGLEQSQNDYLTGSNSDLSGVLAREFHSITGGVVKGNDVVTSLEPAVQSAAFQGLKKTGHPGAAVAFEPSTGRVVALASWPTFNPNAAVLGTPAWVRALRSRDGSLLDRVTQGRYPPGSTFKVITAAAALESRRFTPSSQLQAPDQLSLPQTTHKLQNFQGEQCNGGRPISLFDALRVSCNTAFGGLGLRLGQSALRKQAAAFGFGSSLEIPMGVARSVYPDNLSPPRVAFSAIGQDSDAVTPLQMAMVAAGVANGGVVMTPYLVAKTLAPDLATLSTASPHELGRAVRPGVAAELTRMMQAVVSNGTGGAAQIPGVSVAGKTGTAENQPGQPTHAWFIGFAPAANPQVAVAVLVEHGGVGGVTAAPIARQVMQAVLGP
jgi:penicillin-binding protein A